MWKVHQVVLAVVLVVFAWTQSADGRRRKRTTRYPTASPTASPFLYYNRVQSTETCACDAECLAFGDPVVAGLDSDLNNVKCAAGSDITLLLAYGFSIDATCAGSPTNEYVGWMQYVKIDSDFDDVVREHDAYECEEMEAADPTLQAKKSWYEVLAVYNLYNPSLKRELIVTITCAKRGTIKMVGSHGVQNTVFNVHSRLRRYTDFSGAAVSSVSVLADFSAEGVTGKCLPYTNIDTQTFEIGTLSTSKKKELCSKGGLTYGNDCDMGIQCSADDCQVCYPEPDDGSDEPGDCHYCIKSSENKTCSSNEECCSGTCDDGSCTVEDASQMPPACCDTSKTCYSKLNASEVNDGYCRECFNAQETCDPDRPCCEGLVCGASGTCVPETLIETCECNALCAAVSDPVVRGFAWYSKDIPGNSQVLYSDSTYQSGAGFEITYEAVDDGTGTGGTWITSVFINGEKFFSTDDCPVYRLRDLPRCTKKKCKQKRVVMPSATMSTTDDQNILLNGVWPFTAKNDINVEVHCVSKRRINTGIAGHEYTRLDVYVNKQSAFQKSASVDATSQNAFMMRELEAGTSGKCVEPFSSNTDAIQSLGDDNINGWVKSDKIDPGDCTCNTEGDQERRRLQVKKQIYSHPDDI